jgi:hypothetical protein
MELQYRIDNPLIGSNRVYSETAKRSLFLETSGKCAKCGEPYNALNFNEADGELDFSRSNLEIAHIYGLKNFTGVVHKGNKFHIKDSTQLNTYDNLLLLCIICHKSYDNEPSYEDYVRMVNLKSKLSDNWKLEYYIYNNLFFCLNEIIDVCKDIGYINDFDYEAIKFMQKMENNDIDTLNRKHYSDYLTSYALYIDNFFNDYDEVGTRLMTCFSKVYSYLKEKEKDKNNILRMFSKSDILIELSKCMNEKIFDALISYMIWKCEVLDKR